MRSRLALLPILLSFLLPWLVFFVSSHPALAAHIQGPVLLGLALGMAACPLLTAILIRGLRQRAGDCSWGIPLLCGLLAALLNSPVILLYLAIALQAPMA